jgi:hypothetical protein
MLREDSEDPSKNSIEEVAFGHLRRRYWELCLYLVLFCKIQFYFQLIQRNLRPHYLESLYDSLIILSKLLIEQETGLNLVEFSADLKAFFNREKVAIS